MTNVTITKGKEDYYIVIDGHATGNEAVCTACSTLAYALLNTLVEKNIKHIEEIKDGYMKIVAPSEAKHYVEMAVIGYKMLESSYQEYVQVVEKIDMLVPRPNYPFKMNIESVK